MEFKWSTATCGRTAVICLMIKPRPYDYGNVYACEKCDAAVRSKYSACIVEVLTPQDNEFHKAVPCSASTNESDTSMVILGGKADEVLEFY